MKTMLCGACYINETDRTLCAHDGETWVVIARDVDVEAYRVILQGQGRQDGASDVMAQSIRVEGR